MKHRIILPVALFSFTVAHAAVPVEPSRPTPPAKPAASPAAPSTAPLPVNAEYELRGFFGTGDMLEVSVSKKGAAASDWIPVGRKRGVLTVVSASPKDGTAVVLIGDKRSLLRLGSSKAGSEEISEASELTEADLKDAMEYVAVLNEKMTPEQNEVMTRELMARLSEDEELGRSLQGEELSEAEMARRAARTLPLIGAALTKAMELPAKDGLVHPVPRSLNRVFQSHDAFKRFVESSIAKEASRAK